MNDLITRVYLPEYSYKLIRNDNVTVQITSAKRYANYYVTIIDIDNNYFEVSIENYKNDLLYEFFWTLTGERKDIDRLITEVNK